MELIAESVDVSAVWKDSIHGRALRRIKALLTSAPYLQLPDPIRPYRIHVDGCLRHRGKGAVLLQQSRLWTPPYNPDPEATPPEAPWTPVAYWSKKLSKAERKNYSATAVEASAMHDCIMYWAPYLENGMEFEVIVDRQALVYLATAPAATENKHIIQMVTRLQRFPFRVRYRKGSEHQDADALSRLPLFQDVINEPLDEANSVLTKLWKKM